MELRDYMRMLRSRANLLILSVVVVTSAAVVFSLSQRPAYEGVASVLVTQQNTGITMLGTPQPQVSYQPERDLQTQVEIIRSRPVAERVIETLGSDMTVAEVLSRVTVSAETGANVIGIRAIDATAEGAAELATAFAAVYANWSRDSQVASIKAAADDVERRLTEAQEQIVALDADAASPDATGAAGVRLQTTKALYAELSDKLQQLRIAEQLATGTGSVLAEAEPDPNPVSPRPVRDGALGVAVGLLVGLGVVFVAEQLDNRIESGEEASSIYGAPVLGNIPTEKLSDHSSAPLAVTERPASPAAEAYRMLRNNLDFVRADKGTRTLLITSAVPSEGKSTVAANLALVLSQGGNDVTLVTCDFRLPASERLFGLENGSGLSDALTGRRELNGLLQRVEGQDGLRVLPAGPPPPNPSGLLGSAAMGGLVADLRNSADWVILDSPPLLAAADTAALARWVDGVLVVARLGESERDTARAGCDQLRNVGAQVLGVVVWGPMEGGVVPGSYGYGPS